MNMSRFPRPSKRRRLDQASGLIDDHRATYNVDEAMLGESDHDESDLEASENGFSDTVIDRPLAVKAVSAAAKTSVTKNGIRSARVQPRRTSDAGDLQYAGRLHGPNALRLQLDDLLAEHRFKPTKLNEAADSALRDLKSIIERIPDSDPLPIHEAEKRFTKQHKVTIPFPMPRPRQDSNYKLQFRRPSEINVVGGYPLTLMSKPKHELCVDMLVVMPSDLFQEKDYLDYRYFYRRAFYVAQIATAVRAAGSSMNATYAYLNGNCLQPVVRVQLSREATATGRGVVIQIIPGLDDGVFPVQRTLPTKNLLRNASLGAGESATESLPATPFYNGSLRADALFTSYLKLFSDSSKICEAFKDGCALGRVWLSHRGFSSNVHTGGFGNFEWACILALLLGSDRGAKGILSPGYNGYQLFKATIQFLATNDLLHTGYSTSVVGDSVLVSGKTPSFYDSDRSHNVLYKMTPWSYDALRRSAQNTVDLLGSGPVNSFEPTFLQDVTDRTMRFDAFINVPLSPLKRRLEDPLQFHDTLQHLFDVLRRALTDRTRLIHIQAPALPPWPLESRPTSFSSSDKLCIGLTVAAAQVSRAMDRGPAMDHKRDVKAYLDFWGQEKAVRMKFGAESPIETVKWDTSGSGPSIVQQIVEYVIRRHFGNELADVVSITADDYASQVLPAARPLSQGVEPGTSLIQAFTVFERDLRAIEGLPLQVRHVLAAGPGLRDTELKIPSVGSQLPPVDVVLRFEGSGRWPDDLAAIQQTKTVFLLKLRELYISAHNSVSCHVGLENEEDPILNQAFLDITYAAPRFIFRLRINHEHEATLLRIKVKNPQASDGERKRMARALAVYKQEFEIRPTHTQAIQTLCRRFPSMSVAIRLTKAWFAAHLLLDQLHISEELVELMVARTFTRPWPWDVPGSPSTAFVRTLHWLATWDWKTEPLIVDLSSGVATSAEGESDLVNGTLRLKDIEAIETKFEAHRHIDPALNHLVLFAASNVDRDGNTWTDYSRPSKVVAARMTRLAQAACTLLRISEQPTPPKLLFTVDLEAFDFVLSLNDRVIGSRQKDTDLRAFKNLEVRDPTSHTHNPELVRSYLRELRTAYGDNVILFHDRRDGRSIAGLWNPHTEQYRWKVKMPVSVQPLLANSGVAAIKPGQEVSVVPAADAKDRSVRTNRVAVLDEIRRLGGDMIKDVIVHTPP